MVFNSQNNLTVCCVAKTRAHTGESLVWRQEMFLSSKMGFTLCLAAVLALSFAGPRWWKQGGWKHFPSPQPQHTEWTQINVCSAQDQGDAHLIRFPGGRNFLVDAGKSSMANEFLLPFFRRHRITRLDTVVITHPHEDHYGGLLALLQAGVQVTEVVSHLPRQGLCEKEAGWGCDWLGYQNTRALWEKHGVRIRQVQAGEVLYHTPNTTLSVFAAYSGNELDPTIGDIIRDINDTSILLRLSVGPNTAIFSGDLNKPLSRFLLQLPLNLRANLLKLPHHGTEDLAVNEFFDAVSPAAVFVPSPADLWNSPRSERPRRYFADRNVPAYVSGISGDTRVEFPDNGAPRITTSR